MSSDKKTEEFESDRLYVGDYLWYQWTGQPGCDINYLPYYKVGELEVISALPHEVTFEDGTRIPPGHPSLIEFLKAKHYETDHKESFIRGIPDGSGDDDDEKKEEKKEEKPGLQFVRRDYYFPDNVKRSIDFFMSQFPKEKKVVIMTSMIGIKAGRFHLHRGDMPTYVCPITTDETCRKPGPERRCYLEKWLV